MQKNQKVDLSTSNPAPAPADDVFKMEPVTESNNAELSDDELDGVAGGAACGAGTCSPDMKKHTVGKRT